MSCSQRITCLKLVEAGQLSRQPSCSLRIAQSHFILMGMEENSVLMVSRYLRPGKIRSGAIISCWPSAYCVMPA